MADRQRQQKPLSAPCMEQHVVSKAMLGLLLETQVIAIAVLDTEFSGAVCLGVAQPARFASWHCSDGPPAFQYSNCRHFGEAPSILGPGLAPVQR
jgi:hypothetical protein